MTAETVIVGMSGGVDSSVTALLLRNQGYNVSGLFMFNWAEDEDGYCDAAQDFQDAREVSDALGIDLMQVDFSKEYRSRVFDYFLDEYGKGRTPNPDVLCNREIKFNAFRDYALSLGADYIATGHYARLSQLDGAPDSITLNCAADTAKDQTYFLAAVRTDGFRQVMFPVGAFEKSTIREMARDAGLPVHAKKDSTGICFIGERNFPEFLGRYLPAQPGDIEDDQGRHIGRHGGLMNYTLGQRRGLGIGGRRDALESAWYVIDKQLERNVLVVAQNRDHPLLVSTQLEVTEMNWIGRQPIFPIECQGMIRYRQSASPCTVMADPHNPSNVTVRFVEPQWAATPGQYFVAYEHDRCLGGGVIQAIDRSVGPATGESA